MNNYRHPKTRQEMSKSYDCPELIRAKRNAKNLPDAYDDVYINREKIARKLKKKYKTVDM